MLDSILNRALGDLVEGDAMHFLVVEELFVPQDFLDMPRDGFSLAIRVSCEIEALGRLYRLGDVLDRFARTVAEFPIH